MSIIYETKCSNCGRELSYTAKTEEEIKQMQKYVNTDLACDSCTYRNWDWE